MRMFLALPLLALGACQVTTDDKNDQMTIEYNQDVAENGISDAANAAEDIAGKVSNDVQQTADKVELGREITAADVVLDERYGGPEYGLPNDGTLESIRLCARLEGVMSDCMCS